SATSYTLTNPEPGQWTFEAEVSSDTLTLGKFTEVSDLSTVLALSGSAFGGGDTLTARLAVDAAGTLVTSAPSATFRSPTGSMAQVAMHDDGQAPDTVAGDGIFSAKYVL